MPQNSSPCSSASISATGRARAPRWSAVRARSSVAEKLPMSFPVLESTTATPAMLRLRMSASAATELASGVTLTTGPRDAHPTSATVDAPSLPRSDLRESR